MKSRGIPSCLFNSNRITLYIILSIVIILVFTLTVVYAVLSITLNISGNTEVTAASWNIHFNNIQVNSSNVSTATEPTIINSNTVNFAVTLTNPGDYYMFTVDVVNNGSIDAMIDSIEKLPQLNETQSKYLNYIVEYQSGESINTKQLIEKNSFVRLKVKVEYRKDISSSDLPTTSETLNLSFKVNYTQADETDTTSVPNGGKLVKVVSGDYDTVGSEICIGEECFYVISSDENSLTMLAKYNLYVGNYCSHDNNCTPYGDEATGIQNQQMIGAPADASYPRRGTTIFSEISTNYSESIVKIYVDNYKNYLETQGIKINESRLITIQELEKLGCIIELENCTSSPYLWVYLNSYWVWSNSLNIEESLWRVNTQGVIGVYANYSFIRGFGVRPVITISKF